ncbi:MAG: AIR synthase family protein, partial [Lachnospiraceae bacterium]|nr:AIR synthase family protein [Lachnospiraceae bacterium]
MEIGKIPENVLKRSVMRQLTTKREEVLVGSAVGEDCAAVVLEPDEEFVLSTDPITGTAKDIGNLAVLVTTNDLASAGATPIGIMLTVLLPKGTEEATLKEIMQQVNAACEAANIQVIGGHTEVTDVVNQPVLSVTGVGKVKRGKLISTGGAKPGMDLVATKWIGIEGTAIIAKEKEAELRAHFPDVIVDEAMGLDAYESVQKDGEVAAAHGAAAMHDVTEGGIFGALWEMAEASSVGLDVDLSKIPIRQETVEICEYFDVNPYQLISSGCILIATSDGSGLVRALADA